MKKIGIITFHHAHNYGAVLQAYALQCEIEKLGYDVNIIDYRNKNIEKSYKLIKLSKNPIKCVKTIFESLKYYKKNKKRYEIFEKFINKELKLTKKFKNIKKLKKNYVDMDCYITGSDQVWNWKIVGELSDAYTLNFGNKKANRISYAASIGNSKIEDKYKKQFEQKITNINYISVREEDAKKELEKIINKSIEVVLDPTLLLTKSDWDKETQSMKASNEKYILAYVVQNNDEYVKIVNEISNRTGLKVIHFGCKNPGYKNVLKSAYTEGPMEFINYIKNAEYVVATSFHAAVFSIIFHKKFFIIPHKKTGGRITNLLDKLGIKDRTFNTLEDFENINYNFETNWEGVDQKLEEERKKSLNWLESAINMGKDDNE